MGKLRKSRKFAKVKRKIRKQDRRIATEEKDKKEKKRKKTKSLVRNLPQVSSSMFFAYNESLGPPYRVILDTNFIYFSARNRLDITTGLFDLLMAKTIVYISDCVVGELEKLGPKFKVALKVSKDPRFKRLTCNCNGYADDCLCTTVTNFKCYMIATCDRNLKRRIRKIPGVPIVSIKHHQFIVERLPL
ncbi:rRNA-processing protein fcf1 [Anaeramoeba flamelloides]|uniref:rRNA-processing protein fcf1 n=1 Tax=Anaeramoeba flamelloides TaxID=1746091 RepID=A0ABQ8XYG8_9EUKA|nr:rRNA-processing protein fcf1 [Anaeramoeba flamelloides]